MKMKIATLRDLNPKDKRVLVRVDFNVPLDAKGGVVDDTRIKASLPTITYLLEQGARVILMSHLGRPKGDGFEAKLSLAPVAQRLSQLLKQEVLFAKDATFEKLAEMAASLQASGVLLLENTRFHAGETKNDKQLAKELAALADLYVNDAFGAAHRAHASTAGVAQYLPSAAGLLLEKELAVLGEVLKRPMHPFTAVIGGAKVSDKIAVLENLLSLADNLIIGGGMANTFLKAKGLKMGASLVEDDKLEVALQIMEKAKKMGVKVFLPEDLLVAKEIDPAADVDLVKGDVPGGFKALDIGPESATSFAEVIKASAMVLWNGPMGVFEVDQFARGTEVVARAIADCQAKTIVGGGDSVAALHKVGVSQRVFHISTGGGASLEFLEGKTLPGVAALLEKSRKPVIAGNWKMHHNHQQTSEFIKELKAGLAGCSEVEVIVAPVFTYLAAAVNEAQGSPIKIAAQNMHWEEKGAFTGEVSATMLKDLGVDYCIIGHSERRQYFSETDEMVHKKVEAALRHQLIPIICVGETLAEREADKTLMVIERQVRAALAGVEARALADIIIAYEPIWAIGTGKTASPADAQAVIASIRQCVLEEFGQKAAAQVRIQYGGSVKPGNIADLMQQQDIDGALVGGASLEAVSFLQIIEGV